jgi:tetratricopeptide (TPR) repeat protein
MSLPRRVGVGAVVLAIAAPVAVGLLLRPSDRDLAAAGPAIPVREETGPYRPYQYVLTTEQVIRYYQDRAARDPDDFVTRTLLAQAYVREARETGDFTCYDRAEAAAAEALKRSPSYLAARACRAVVLSARHQFAEALREALALYEETGQADVLLIAGDARLELGQVAEAERTYQDVRRKDPTLPVDSRLARVEELRGHTEEALRLMGRAAQEETGADGNRRGESWYEFRLGEMHWNAGRLEEAARHYEAALALNPGYPLAQLFLARVRAAQGREEEAVQLYGKAVGRYATVPALAELADLYARRGNEYLARLNYDKIEQAAAAGGGAYDRELALYYADHGRNLPEAVELARRDLRLRQDISAYDTLAWALCQNGRYAEAEKAMTEALKLGTQDARFFYHAGMIARGRGDKAGARQYLERALAVNPYFSPRQAQLGRQALADLAVESE